jgi:hypothetical protein
MGSGQQGAGRTQGLGARSLELEELAEKSPNAVILSVDSPSAAHDGQKLDE